MLSTIRKLTLKPFYRINTNQVNKKIGIFPSIFFACNKNRFLFNSVNYNFKLEKTNSVKEINKQSHSDHVCKKIKILMFDFFKGNWNQ